MGRGRGCRRTAAHARSAASQPRPVQVSLSLALFLRKESALLSMARYGTSSIYARAFDILKYKYIFTCFLKSDKALRESLTFVCESFGAPFISKKSWGVLKDTESPKDTKDTKATRRESRVGEIRRR